MLYGTRGNTALKPQYDTDLDLEPAPLEELIIPPSERASIMTLKESMCRWPIGDPGEPEFHFCGRKKCGTLPYCEHHARMAYQPVQMRRREKRFATG
jgi:GcrA cell cycle regulator